jgi:hypothetical protein
MRSLPEERSKVTSVSSRNPDPDGQTTTKSGQTARFCLLTVRPPAQPVRLPAPGTEAPCPILGTHKRVGVTTANLSSSTVASSVFPVTKILAIEDHKLDNIFLHLSFGSQSLLKSTSDQIISNTN